MWVGASTRDSKPGAPALKNIPLPLASLAQAPSAPPSHRRWPAPASRRPSPTAALRTALKELVRELGPSIRAGTREEAARADIVFVAVNWTKLPAALTGLPEWSGRILIDANNPIEAPLFKPVDLKGRVSSEVVAELVPGARVIKAFNHLRAEVLAGDPRSDGGRRVLFYSGNDSAAKAEVAALIDRIGFVGIDLGSLAVGGKLAQFPGGPLPNQNLVKVG
jgi:predicted dinucleotide-binding enzyme